MFKHIKHYTKKENKNNFFFPFLDGEVVGFEAVVIGASYGSFGVSVATDDPALVERKSLA